MKNTVVLLSGSNVGDRLEELRMAKTFLLLEQCLLKKESSIYETAAWGNREQSSFLNQVWVMETEKEPFELLTSIMKIERRMGRERIQKWEPRLIDIDILFFNDIQLNTAELVIPHPYLHERKFALMPLVEIIPGWVHPVFHQTVSELLEKVKDDLDVKKTNL